ncbi:DUF4157 domain-containing protein [Nitrosovibrio sp. Nv6]|uniref:eCIS core domain-containing protein n=1 Tax=Nitrosovibrio sp. Nv6 TaxID=1855340 RepID=UPI0008B6873A|nr:DUF4157 domain-containing protein [Nitrosovibrio sp. Nv6]SEO73221.1 YwqJ-like deaminase [Nitrosovibrio sp. Nv6]
MNEIASQTRNQPRANTLPASSILQRKCECGSHTVAGGECVECSKREHGLQRKTNEGFSSGRGNTLSGISLQRKLTIGASDDPLEQEADRVADQVMAKPTHSALSDTPLRIQRYSGQTTGDMNTAPASVDRVLASSGRPLEPALRQDMEQRFGHDFSQVRVHSDDAAEQSARHMNARAYTVGHNIVFGAGQYAPGTAEGKRLVTHELTHVVQQGRSMGERIQCAPGEAATFSAKTLEPLENVAQRIARLAAGDTGSAMSKFNLKGGPDKVISVVRNMRTGQIYVGLNTGPPANVTEVIRKATAAQKARIAAKEVNVVQTSAIAIEGGHAEVNALNKAIAQEESALRRAMTEAELGATFEMHNVWLSGERKLTTAPRCEHCARITRSVAVTESLFKVEGGVSGEINVPQRGKAVKSGGKIVEAEAIHGEISVRKPPVKPPTTVPEQVPETVPKVEVPGVPSVGRLKGLGKSLLKGAVAGLVPGPDDIPDVVLSLADRAAAVEAIRRIQVKFAKEGFAKGVAAGVMWWSEEEVRLNLKNRVTPFRIQGLEDPAGFLGLTYILRLAEAYENYAIDRGYQFGTSHTLEWKKVMRDIGFGFLAERGYHYGEDPGVLFENEFIKDLAYALRPITDPIADEAIEKGEERRRQKWIEDKANSQIYE